MTCPICSQPLRQPITCEVCSRVVCGINCSSGRLDTPELVIWCKECCKEGREKAAQPQ